MTPKKKPKKATSKKKESHFLQRFILTLIVLGVVGAAAFAGYNLYLNLPGADLEEFIPAKETVVYVEFSDLNLPTQVQSLIQPADFEAFLNQLTGLPVSEAVTHFGKGAVSFVLMETDDGGGEWVVLVEARNKTAALDYFESLLLEGESFKKTTDEYPIYDFPQGEPFSFKWLDGYVAMAKNPLVLEQFIPSDASLAHDEAFLKSVNQLPRRGWILAYSDLKKLGSVDMGTYENIIQPLTATSRSLTLSLRKEESGVHFNTFLTVKKDLVSLKPDDPEELFEGDLADYLSADTVGLYLGGQNLENEWQNTLQTISNLNPAYGIIMEGLLRAQTDRVFGEGVDLRNDLYPLFANEYAFTFAEGENTGGRQISLLLAHDDRVFAEAKLEKMAEGFKSIAAHFTPKIHTVTLPDGTESRELIPDDSSVETLQETVGDQGVTCTQVGSKASFCYTITNELVIMTSGMEAMKKHLNPETETRLSEDSRFDQVFSQLSGRNDEVSFVRFENVAGFFESYEWMQPVANLLEPFDSAGWVKHYFDDGASAEGYVLFK